MRQLIKIDFSKEESEEIELIAKKEGMSKTEYWQSVLSHIVENLHDEKYRNEISEVIKNSEIDDILKENNEVYLSPSQVESLSNDEKFIILKKTVEKIKNYYENIGNTELQISEISEKDKSKIIKLFENNTNMQVSTYTIEEIGQNKIYIDLFRRFADFGVMHLNYDKNNEMIRKHRDIILEYPSIKHEYSEKLQELISFHEAIEKRQLATYFFYNGIEEKEIAKNELKLYALIFGKKDMRPNKIKEVDLTIKCPY